MKSILKVLFLFVSLAAVFSTNVFAEGGCWTISRQEAQDIRAYLEEYSFEEEDEIRRDIDFIFSAHGTVISVEIFNEEGVQADVPLIEVSFLATLDGKIESMPAFYPVCRLADEKQEEIRTWIQGSIE